MNLPIFEFRYLSLLLIINAMAISPQTAEDRVLH